MTKSNNTNENIFKNLFDWYKGTHKDVFSKYIETGKIVLALGTFMGFMYLFSYTTTQNIPFPLSITELIPAFLVILFVGTMVVIVLLGMVLIPVIARSNMFDGIFQRSFDKENCSIKSKIFTYISNTGLFLSATILWFFWSVLKKYGDYNILLGITVFCSALAIYLYIRKGREVKDNKFYFSTSIILLISVFWFLTLLQLSIGYIDGNVFEKYIEYIIVAYVVISLVINFIMVSPVGLNEKITSDKFALMILVLSVMAPFMGNAASFVAGAALKIIGIGGGEKVIYYIDEKHKKSVSTLLLHKKNKTKTLYLVLDLGDRVFVRLENNPNEKSYALKRNIIVSEFYFPKLERKKN